MSLQNLFRIRLLAVHSTDARQVGRMLEAVKRGIADARQQSISSETRLDAAYRAIMQAAMVALWANGYRPSTNVPGHHKTLIQSLVHSIGLDNDTMLLLDTFRVKRNAADYTGEDIDEVSVDSCIVAAEGLHRYLISWLTENSPELLA